MINYIKATSERATRVRGQCTTMGSEVSADEQTERRDGLYVNDVTNDLQRRDTKMADHVLNMTTSLTRIVAVTIELLTISFLKEVLKV